MFVHQGLWTFCTCKKSTWGSCSCEPINNLPNSPSKFITYPENALHENVNRRTLEIREDTRIFKYSYCLKVHNATLKLAFLISG